MTRLTWGALGGGAVVLTTAGFLGPWPLAWAVLAVPLAAAFVLETAWRRRFLEYLHRDVAVEHRERVAETRRFVRELVDGAHPEMPLMTPWLLCPDCGELGAHLAELTANGAHWRRECVHCEYRWLEP